MPDELSKLFKGFEANFTEKQSNIIQMYIEYKLKEQFDYIHDIEMKDLKMKLMIDIKEHRHNPIGQVFKPYTTTMKDIEA